MEIVRKILAYLKQLTDFASTYSSNRFSYLFTTVVSTVVFWGTWSGICIYNGSIVDIPAGVYISYGMAIGIVALGKFGQSFTERNTQDGGTADPDGKQK
ncbi:MAG: hypothetical protein LLG40_11260 [Deltaproteobacteria bacterium]|nr:hypothetical protein [Deltaproteobacteria bacterium]